MGANDNKEETYWLSADSLLSIVSFFKREKPALVETILSWMISLILGAYYGIGYMKSTQQKSKSQGTNDDEAQVWNVPLTTTNRSKKMAQQEALHQLLDVIETSWRKKWETVDDTKVEEDDDIIFHQMSNEDFIEIMKSHVEARRLATIVMKFRMQQVHNNNSDMMDTDKKHKALLQKLEQTWSKLLQLPPIDNPNNTNEYPFAISVVVPAHRENGLVIQSNLSSALRSCQNPQRIQILLIDAGNNTDLEKALLPINSNHKDTKKQWGDIQCLPFTDGGGRGPTLNFGARHAKGRIITFFHSDNILPEEWDTQIQAVFDDSSSPKPIVCAFSFRINLSKQALHDKDGNPPPGIAAAQWLGEIRTQKFKVLYGDSVISMPASYFRYLGGYPDQALMEDYELMDLLRKRVAYLVSSSTTTKAPTERLCILPSETLISPRRWELKGPTYTTMFNCLCVYMYVHRGWSPEELYAFYYQRPAT